jgi:peptidoglycan/LPS O-acetylase OafA/YrhL
MAWHYVFCGLPPRGSDTPILAALRSALWLSYSGVDLFFVISGFLIGRILLEARDEPHYYRTFYARRALRILPLYALVVALALGLRALRPARLVWLLGGGSPSWWAYATFLQTIWMVQQGVFGTNALGMTWSLAIEEHFYVLAPFVNRALPRRGLPWLLVFLVVGAPGLRAWFAFQPGTSPFIAYVLMPCRVDALALGMLAAWAMRSPRITGFLVRAYAAIWAIVVASVVALGLGLMRPKVPLSTPPTLIWGFSVLALLYVSLLLLVVTQPRKRLARALSWSPLVSLGRLCFGLYLFHELVLGLCHGIIFGRAPMLRDTEDCWITALAFLLTLVVARASWRFVEQPLIALGHRLRYGSRAEGS